MVALYLGWAWRRGSIEARDFLGAWGLPMAVLAFIHIVDIEDGFWGGGSKLVVLVAATWQALWLAAAATRRPAQLRIERDHARDARSEEHTSALQSLMRNTSAVLCLIKNNTTAFIWDNQHINI